MGDSFAAMASESSVVETLLTWNTAYSADSVEWCPVEPYLNVLVCGTYQLQNEDENLQGGGDKDSTPYKRLGRIYLFYIDSKTTSLEPIQTIETSAVLDQKWCQHPINGFPHLGVVNAAGFLQIYKLSEEEALYKLDLVTQFDVSQESKVLALSMDWSTGKTEAEEPHIVISDSGGNITECMLQKDGNIEKLNSWNAHSFEAWICAFDYWDTAVIYTGGDDCCFKVFDRRCGSDAKLVNRCHEAGVTSLHCSSKQEHILASGSYDETLRLWDTRSLRRPISEQVLGGGIWRIKWDPMGQDTLLVACMYGGFRVVDTKSSTLSVVAEYNEHQSIAYGADWCKDTSCLQDDSSHKFRRVFSTCSFYDCKLNVAQIKY